VAATYAEWKALAQLEDASSGADRWKVEDASPHYDYKVIRYRYDELVAVRESRNLARLLYYLNEGLHGNMGGMGSPQLYTRARFGTKDLITRYVHEVGLALGELVAAPDEQLSRDEKRAYLTRAQACYGRSALMLSGAGSLGPFHLGVLKTLLEQDVLPSVISGASAGSAMAAIVATRSREDSLSLLGDVGVQSALVQSDVPSGRRITAESLTKLVAQLIPDLTFLEAQAVSGLQLNVSVAPSKSQQRSRLLNAITAPNALVREAVIASCAIPGVFPPVMLMGRDADGTRQPYVPSRRWVDGSISGDLPAQRLARLYGVNHFITSQTNPVVLWSLQDGGSEDGLFGRLTRIYQASSREWLRAVYPYVLEAATRSCPQLANATQMLFSVLTQEYTADINILPTTRRIDYSKLVSTLSPRETLALFQDGERATWPKVETIRVCTHISRTIESLLRELDDRHTVTEPQERQEASMSGEGVEHAVLT
jgi:TAG lipase/steryl ester hydrolase/phospholipase A2/LPA acyltransferase